MKEEAKKRGKKRLRKTKITNKELEVEVEK